jgi:putative (di)nucleoside polyphosphate hydrolase
MTEVYRRAASLLLLRQTARGYEFLLLHKPRKGDAWQLPQGGIEQNEDVTQAALRELKEEAGIDDCKVLGVSSSAYQYDFPPAYRRFRPDNVKGQRIEFVLAVAKDDVTVTVDKNEIDKHVWVNLEEMEKYVKRKQYADLVKELFDEAMNLVG